MVQRLPQPTEHGVEFGIGPTNAQRLNPTDGDPARVTTARGSLLVPVEVSDRMHPGHVSLPNGMGLRNTADDARVGAAPNELTASDHRDWLAGTPWHKHIAAQVEAATF